MSLNIPELETINDHKLSKKLTNTFKNKHYNNFRKIKMKRF